MTDLQVVQPVLTLILHLLFRLRATTLSGIVGRRMGQHTSDERKDCRKQEIRADESNDAACFIRKYSSQLVHL